MVIEQKEFTTPIVLFTFRRLDTVKMIMREISQIRPTTLYIFSDGYRENNLEEKKKVFEVREYLREAVTWKCDYVLEFAEKNMGCANRIKSGIDMVFSKENSAIILEDDVVPTNGFFYFCQELLKKYADNKNIQYIAGFNAVGDCDFLNTDYTFSYNGPLSGAFATWSDCWNECDFCMKEWPQIKKEKRFRKYFKARELYRHFEHAFDESYKGNNEGWDYQFEYNKFRCDRLSIVPKYNLVSNIGFDTDALHGVDSRKAEKMRRMLSASSRSINFPMDGPVKCENHKEYSELRQKYFLEVNGNYVYRHINYTKRKIKDLVYKILPKVVWDRLKRIVSLILGNEEH